MHSREPIRPAFHSSSISCQLGSAKRSSAKSVVSEGAIVPSKSTKTWHFTRPLDTIYELFDCCHNSGNGLGPPLKLALFTERQTPCQRFSLTAITCGDKSQPK